jgi:hypothetical protein
MGTCQPRSVHRTRVLHGVIPGLAALVCYWSEPCFGYSFDVGAEVVPSQPSTYQPTVIRLTGMSTNSCVPMYAGPFEDDYTYIVGSSPGPCLEVETPWTLDVPLSQLPEGSYSFDFMEWGTGYLTGVVFEVRERLGSVTHGATLRRAVCRNLTTQQSVVVETGADAVNCEAAGLHVSPGDKVTMRMRGTAGSKP